MDELYEVLKQKEQMENHDRIPNYPYISPFANEKVQLKYFTNEEGLIEKARVCWVYSFWARRRAEGNSEKIYSLISGIKI